MASDKSVSVRVLGLREVQLAFNRVGHEASAAMKGKLLGIADRIAGRARSKVPSRSGRAASSIIPRATSRGAAIAFGGSAAPYLPWLDFGGSVGRGHKPRRYWSGAIKRDWLGRPVGEGRYVYPAISEYRVQTMDAVLEAVMEVARAADFEVR